MNYLSRAVADEFWKRFKQQPQYIARAPGRVNLIGEHTDYNDGFVLPLAINRAMWIALRPRNDRMVRLHSMDQGDDLEIDLNELRRDDRSWKEYPKGVAWSLLEAGFDLQGWEGVSHGDVPIGAGLSSSAAFELAVARAFASVSGLEWNAAEMARLCQRAENEWVGVNCGIMDQMISAAGKDAHALLIDCRSLTARPVPLPLKTLVVVLDTATRRGLVDSAYNERRAQCQAAAAFFGVPALRDVSMAHFNARADQMNEVIRRRARHVISENQRTLDAACAIEGEPFQLGRLMNESHASLRDDFEVSNPQLDAMSDIARNTPGCFGARMTGAGFGGCAVALIERDQQRAFVEHVTKSYTEQTRLTPSLYVCEASEGATVYPEGFSA